MIAIAACGSGHHQQQQPADAAPDPFQDAPSDAPRACHGMTRQHLRYWRALSDTAMASCLTDLQVTTEESARHMIDCLRAMPAMPTSDFMTPKLGIYATAAKLPWFRAMRAA